MDWNWCSKIFHVFLVLELSGNSLNKKIKELSRNKLNDYEEMSIFLLFSYKHCSQNWKTAKTLILLMEKKNVNIKFIFILEKRKIKVKRHNCKIIYVFSFYSLFYKLSSIKQTKKNIILYSVFIYIFSIPFHSNFVWNIRKLRYNTIGFYSYFEKIQIKSKLYM